jgi:hypothetical protein
MEILALLFFLAIAFMFLSGALNVIWWVIRIVFQISCFFTGVALIGLVFIILMVGCLANLAK